MSGSTFPKRFSKIDDLTRPDHPFLQSDDDCYFLSEYTAGKDYKYSATNGLISNFKKTMDKQGRVEWHYKEEAIQEVAVAFRIALQDTALDTLSFVPIPPSKTKADNLYDDRVVRMLRSIRPQPPVDVRELISQKQSTAAVHESGIRLSPEGLEALYAIDEASAQRPIKQIAIVDDVLTKGAHFRAAKSILARRFPYTKIVGLFIARAVHETVDLGINF